MSSTGTLEDAIARTGLIVGSPAQVVDKIMGFRDKFGDYQRQLFAVDAGGVPEKSVLETLDLLGEEVVPALRRQPTVRIAPTK
jgi:alkanesulfonate monooxygenase SsuD/methylene tetrahydromethanopterin reductase-like flavin-dependent oxidoreductase (luciferase family)